VSFIEKQPMGKYGKDRGKEYQEKKRTAEGREELKRNFQERNNTPEAERRKITIKSQESKIEKAVRYALK